MRKVQKERPEFLSSRMAANQIGVRTAWLNRKIESGEIRGSKCDGLYILKTEEWDDWRSLNKFFYKKNTLPPVAIPPAESPIFEKHRWAKSWTNQFQAPKAKKSAQALLNSAKSFHIPTWITDPVIYFLFNNGELVYVGKSVRLAQRLSNHHLEKKFDAVKYVVVPKEYQDELEKFFILFLMPRLNKDVNIPSFPVNEIRKFLIYARRIARKRKQ